MGAGVSTVGSYLQYGRAGALVVDLAGGGGGGGGKDGAPIDEKAPPRPASRPTLTPCPPPGPTVPNAVRQRVNQCEAPRPSLPAHCSPAGGSCPTPEPYPTVPTRTCCVGNRCSLPCPAPRPCASACRSCRSCCAPTGRSLPTSKSCCGRRPMTSRLAWRYCRAGRPLRDRDILFFCLGDVP